MPLTSWTETGLLTLAHLLAALGCGLIGGVFFAFSTFVMKALARIPAAQGIAAMQSINRVVINPWFLGIFLGTAALSVVLLVATLMKAAPPTSLVAGVLYFAGTFLVTMAGNVPLNNRLEMLDPCNHDADTIWRDYLRRWTRWNHVRTAAALAACALLIAGGR